MNPVLATLVLGLIFPTQGPTTPAPQAPEPDLRAGLTLEDLNAREAFLDAVLADARRSPERCAELTIWLDQAADGKDELAWTARLARRELERPPADDPLLGLLGGGHGVDVLFIGSQPGALDVTWTELPEGPTPELELDATLEGWISGITGQPNRFPLASPPGLGDCTLELRLGADWAHLRLLEAPTLLISPETEGDAPEAQLWTSRVREYQGRTLADIVGRNPDLVGLLPFEVPGVVAPLPGPRTDVLGVFARSVSPEQCQALGLDPGCGLEVVRVQPGTVAEVLGIAPGSVVLEVCGTVVRGQDGILEAMQLAEAEHPDCGLCVVWLDAFGRQHQRAWKGGESPAPEAKQAPAELPGGLRPVED